MKTKMFILWAVMIVISCSDNDDSVCGIINPTEDLSWLKNEIEDREATTSEYSQYFYIAQATYKFQTVFVFEDCCPFCNTAIFVFDCAGNRIGQINNGIQRKDVKNTKVIYKPKDFKCV